MREKSSVVVPLNPNHITIPPERTRKLRPEVVDELAASIKHHQRLLQPIAVRRKGSNYILVAGRHRLEAVRKLELDSVLTVILSGLTAAEAEIAEIDENLVRAELSPAERALHVDRRKQLFESRHPQAKHGGAPGKAGGGKKAKGTKLGSFAEETAKATGQSKTTVKRDATRGKNVVVLRDVVGTSLDKGEQLDALAKLPVEEQRKLAKRAKAGEKVSAKPTKPRTEAKEIKPTTLSALPDPIQEDCEDCETPQARWQQSLRNLAGDLIALDAYWTHEFGDAWKSFEVTSELVTLAKQAADAWKSIASTISKRREEAPAQEPPAPTDDELDIPGFLKREVTA